MRKGVIALIIFAIAAAASTATAGYRYYTINHIDDRLEKLYAKEDEINEAMSKADEENASAIEEAGSPYSEASEALDSAWSRYYDLESYNSDLTELIDNYGEEESEETESEETEEEESESEEESVAATQPSTSPAPASPPEQTQEQPAEQPASNPVPPDLDLLDCETYVKTDAEGHYIIYDSNLDEYGYYDEDGAWWTLENYDPNA